MKALRYTALALNREDKQLFRRDWIDIDAPSAAIESDAAIDERENCVIAAEADVFARQKFCAALAHDNVSGDNRFAAESFYAETFADAVAAVLNTALSFFVCHDLRFLCFGAAGDAFDFYPREFTAMADGAVITFAPSVFERDDFFVFALLDDFSGDLPAVADLFAINMHQYFERGRFARLHVQKIDIHRVAFRDAILPSASLDDCVGHRVFPGRKSRANSHRTPWCASANHCSCRQGHRQLQR